MPSSGVAPGAPTAGVAAEKKLGVTPGPSAGVAPPPSAGVWSHRERLAAAPPAAGVSPPQLPEGVSPGCGRRRAGGRQD
jgi:hypothetical protein